MLDPVLVPDRVLLASVPPATLAARARARGQGGGSGDLLKTDRKISIARSVSNKVSRSSHGGRNAADAFTGGKHVSMPAAHRQSFDPGSAEHDVTRQASCGGATSLTPH